MCHSPQAPRRDLASIKTLFLMNDGGPSREERASLDGGRHVSPSLSLASLVGVSETWYKVQSFLAHGARRDVRRSVAFVRVWSRLGSSQPTKQKGQPREIGPLSNVQTAQLVKVMMWPWSWDPEEMPVKVMVVLSPIVATRLPELSVVVSL